jgi:hypothetical protein
VDTPEQNMVNAGLIFVYSVWLQSQMCDLVIARRHPDLVPAFVGSPTRVPPPFHKLRAKYWELSFDQVVHKFAEAFKGELHADEKTDLNHVCVIRNMIGHAHISGGRDYMLYRPAGGKRERAVVAALDLQPMPDQSNPLMIKLEFWRPEVFRAMFDRIERLDQECFARLAKLVDLPHSRIR